MQHIPQDIQNNLRYEELLQDKEVQEHLAKAHEEYQAQQDSLQDSHPFKKEEVAHHRRKLTPTQDIETLKDDVKEFDTYNKKHKGTLDSLLNKQEQNDITLTDKRQYALNAWEQMLKSKKNEYIEQEKLKQTRDYKQRLTDYLESLLETKEFLSNLGGAGELFSGALDEMKQGLDVSNLGDEAYQNKLKGQRIEMPGGKGIGSGAGIRNRIDINTIKQYFNTIQNSKALKEIAELLGRLEKEEEESEIQKIKELKSYSYTQIIPTKRYKEEICGVTLGRDLENLLPQELAMLEDESLELLFDLKYIQNRLFCFEKQGYHSITQEAQEEIEKEIETKKAKEKREK